ncbi:DUF4012 domain-containing protein [Patescibacteria group bacterium]|nr:DUF4012 domain-containing protein [Patescibacteria group bacterium]
MLKNFAQKSNTLVTNYLKSFKGAILYVLVDKTSNYKETLNFVQNAISKNYCENILIISSIYDQNSKTLSFIEKFIDLRKKTKQKGLVNLLYIGEILEQEKNYINQTLKEVKRKKILIEDSHDKQEYYYVSIQDFVLCIKEIINQKQNSKKYRCFLKGITKKQILEIIKRENKKVRTVFYNAPKKRSLKELEIYDISKLTLINSLKVSVTGYINEESHKISKLKKYLIEKKFLIKTILISSVFSFIAIIFLAILDFSIDNYLLFKSINNSQLDSALIYSNKLRGRNLPFVYGANYHNAYSSLYYGLKAYTLFSKSLEKNELQKLNRTQEGIEYISKALFYSEKLDKNLFLTLYEKQKYEKYENYIKTFNENKNYLSLLDIYNDLNNKKYLILIQNSNELRTSGGFIGSSAYFDLINNRILNYKFYDIYAIDGTLEKKFPEKLQPALGDVAYYLKTKFLYTRDLSTLINSKERDKLLFDYFETALGLKFDAIIYTNFDTIKRILKINGPVYLAQYKTEINDRNIDVIAQDVSESSYFEGSPQKVNFLSLAGSRVISDFFQNKKYLNLDFPLELIEMLNSKELLFSFKNQTIQNLIESLHLSFPTFYKNYSNFLLIENNFGENKVNKKIQKSAEMNIEYDKRRGVKITNVTINIINTATSNTWPYGKYKGVMYINIPSNALVTQLISKFEDNTNPKSINLTRSITKEDYEDFTFLKIDLDIDLKQKQTISLEYEELVKTNNKGVYILFQPGSKAYDLKLNYKTGGETTLFKTLTVNKDIRLDID